MMFVVCSVRDRAPNVIVQATLTSTFTSAFPRSVATEYVVTLPLGSRVNWVTPFAVGKALILTVSVAFWAKGATLGGVTIRVRTADAFPVRRRSASRSSAAPQ